MTFFQIAMCVAVLLTALVLIFKKSPSTNRPQGRDIVIESHKREAAWRRKAEQAESDALAEHDSIYRQGKSNANAGEKCV